MYRERSMTSKFKYIAYTQNIATQCAGQLTTDRNVRAWDWKGGSKVGAIELSTVFITLKTDPLSPL